MWPRAEGLRAFAFADNPGPMRTRLTALALAGTKNATGTFWQRDYVDEGEAIEVVGERQALLGDDDQIAAIIEITRVETHRFVDVPWEFAESEGEGFRSIEDWREGHRSYFANLGVQVDDDMSFVCVWFRVVERRAEVQ
jgi:uncharacterized protein YhfF